MKLAALPNLLPCAPLLLALPLALSLALTACGGPPDQGEPSGSPLDAVAERYVKLVLALGNYDPDYVDAYYGPPEWKTAAEAEPVPLEEIRGEGERLLRELEAIDPAPIEELERLRHGYLVHQLSALVARVRMLEGERFTFDEESRALYDAVAPHLGEDHFEAVLAEIDVLLAGQGVIEGTLADRLQAFRGGFAIPAERLDEVFRAAIDACRDRTAAHLTLPPGESFEVEYVTGKSWSAYNWYQGGYHSLIQVNTDLPVTIDRAVDLACHEGYPGHHVYNALLEQHLVRGRGWPELSVYPLFSPQSLIAEGSADFGIRMAFPGGERLTFERDVLFPRAGLDPAGAAPYRELMELVDQLSYAGNEAARRYLDGEIDGEEAARWLTHYAAMSPERAAQRVRFIEQYRSYVINYNLGEDLVRESVESRGGTPENPARRWELFGELLSTPRWPSGLPRGDGGG
jgi:hypothetical protein